MPLIKEQVQTIFQLVKEHIPYYDLQVEMVDHLASNVEEKLEADPIFSFEQALQTAYAGFGSSGFRLLIRKRRKTLVRQKWHAWFQALLKQVSTYRLLFTIFIFGLAAYVATFWQKEVTEVIMLFVLMSYFLISFSAEYFIGKKEKQKLLLTETFRASLLGFVFPQMLLWIVVKPLLDHFDVFGFASAFTGFMMTLKATLIVNRNAFYKAQQLYPEAFINA